MTTDDNSPQKENVEQRPAPVQQKRIPLKPMAIIFASAIVLSASSCAVMASTFLSAGPWLKIATCGFFAGLAAILVVFVWAVVALILRLVKKMDVHK